MTQGSKPSFQGVELTVAPLLGEHLVLIGDRPRTGIQRLGGTPGRQPPQGSVTGVPERGSQWAALDGDTRVRVADVQIGETTDGPGRRMTVKAHTTDVPSREIELGLQEFLGLYRPLPFETAVVSETPPEKRRTPEPPPCEMGEEWISPEGKFVKVGLVTDNSVVVRHEEGLAQTIPTYIFKTRYKKAPPRRSVYERLMDDED